MEPKRMISVSEASQILQVGERQVRRYCNEEKLHCERQGKAFLIDYESVLEFKETGFSSDTNRISEDFRKLPEADIGHGDVRDIEPDVRTMSEQAVPCPENTDIVSDEEEDADMAELQQTLAELKQAVVKRLQWEKRFAAKVGQTLKQLDTSYKAEKQRNQQVQAELRNLLGKLQLPLAKK